MDQGRGESGSVVGASRPLRWVRLWYVAALLGIVATVGASHWQIERFLHELGDDARVINIAGRQRMLSQKLGRDVLQAARAIEIRDAEVVESELAQIRGELAELQEVHLALTLGDAELGVRPSDDPVVREMLAVVGEDLDRLIASVEAFLLWAEAPSGAAPVDGVLASTAAFLPNMNAAVNGLERESQRALGGVALVDKLLFFGTILLLGLEVLIIFEPLVRRLRRQYAELVRAEARAVEGGLAKERFLTTMSHELRTPLTAVIGGIDSLRMDELDAAGRAEREMLVARNARHLLGLINDILDFAKLEQGEMVIERRVTKLHQLGAEIISMTASTPRSPAVEFVSSFEWPLPEYIETDSLRVRQILINLLSNAMKFTEIGTVSFDIRRSSDGWVEFVVRDTGIGMSSEQVRDVFDAFVQADSSISRRFGGTGLGLAISKRLSGLIGGELLVESELGVGSTFTLRVPSPVEAELVNGSPETREAEAAPALEPLSGRVLLAEDFEPNRQLISHLLGRFGLSVVAVENGREAVSAAIGAMGTGEAFDLVVLDMQMPVLDGYGAARELRRAGFGAPIMALTAHSLEDERRRCLDAGCDAFMSKPIDRAGFHGALRSWLGRVGGARDAA